MSMQAAWQRAARPPVLALDKVSIAYEGNEGRRRVVHEVSFTIEPGEVVALVGESGSGKTTTAQAIIGLLADNGHLEQGTIRLHGTDIAGWSSRRLDAVRGAQISLIPQDPASSLNPVKTIGEQVAEIVNIHRRLPRAQVQQRVTELLTRVGLTHPELRARQFPHQLSGGMKQRVLIAIAIALQPALIIADEPSSALDVTVQKRILDLIDELRRESGTAVLLVTHDLGVAAERADRLLVFRHGRVQEQGATAEVLRAPASAADNLDPQKTPATVVEVGRADPDVIKSQFYPTNRDGLLQKGGTSSNSNFSDDKLNALLLGIASEVDAQKRLQTAGEAQNYLIDQAYVIPFFEEPQVFAGAPYLKGVSFEAVGRPSFYGAWLEKH